MMMEVELKRVQPEEKQMKMDIQMRMEEREFQQQMMCMLTQNTHGMSPSGAPSYPMHFTCGYGDYDADTTQDGMQVALLNQIQSSDFIRYHKHRYAYAHTSQLLSVSNK